MSASKRRCFRGKYPPNKESSRKRLVARWREIFSRQSNIAVRTVQNVDGFAIRSTDLASAAEFAPVHLMLNEEVIACGTTPTQLVLPETATPIATGGPIPRGADAVVMVEHTEPSGERAIEVRRSASPGNLFHLAGSDIARGEALLRAGTVIGSREIGMLAACRSPRGPLGGASA